MPFDRDTAVFTWPVRVYWEDTDAGGIVYHTAYLRFAERARTEMLRAAGIDQGRMLADTGVAFAVTRVEVDFRRPAVLDDALDVSAQVSEVGSASLRMTQAIRRGADDLVRLVVRVACVNRLGRPVRLPATVRSAFTALTAQSDGSAVNTHPLDKNGAVLASPATGKPA